MIYTFINPEDGSFVEAPDENVMLMKKVSTDLSMHVRIVLLSRQFLIITLQGLDLRLAEYEEDCRRIQRTERKLQRRIEECTLTYETSLIDAKGEMGNHIINPICLIRICRQAFS